MEFAERVYRVVALIPEGCVTNYGSIARALGAPRGARMVGWVLSVAREDRNLPAHRVVNREGVLTGAPHFGPAETMKLLLQREGVTFIDDITVDFKKHYWDPASDPRVDGYFEFRDS